MKTRLKLTIIKSSTVVLTGFVRIHGLHWIRDLASIHQVPKHPAGCFAVIKTHRTWHSIESSLVFLGRFLKSIIPKKNWLMISSPIWIFPKIVGFPPKSSILTGFFHYFHHPFWGYPKFLETPIQLAFWMSSPPKKRWQITQGARWSLGNLFGSIRDSVFFCPRNSSELLANSWKGWKVGRLNRFQPQKKLVGGNNSLRRGTCDVMYIIYIYYFIYLLL